MTTLAWRECLQDLKDLRDSLVCGVCVRVSVLGKLPRYRARASQFFLRPHNRAGAEAVEGEAGRSTQSEPEQEPTAEDDVGGGPEKEDSEDEVPLPIDEQEVPDPPEPIAMPSL